MFLIGFSTVSPKISGFFFFFFLTSGSTWTFSFNTSDGKASACNAGDPGSILGLGRSPGEGNGNPLQYYCLQNCVDRGAWWATVHGVAKSWTSLSDFTFIFNSPLPDLYFIDQVIQPQRHYFKKHCYEYKVDTQVNDKIYLYIINPFFKWKSLWADSLYISLEWV